MSKYNELVKKLKEIFQIDRPELDFGIYRILNAKGDEINHYLENTLKAKITDTLASAGNANKAEIQQQLADAIKGAEALGVVPDDIPKVKYLQQQIADILQGANQHENAVFSHMLTFFSRYYDSGDFVSKRRYKGDTYAIPYAGEEVMLHWANKDQYYIKSGENFANYSFKLEDGRKVSFKLLAADTAKDNRKDNDADRRFVLIEPHIRTKFDDEGNEFEEEYQPVSVNNDGDKDELIIQFAYKIVKKGSKQTVLVEEALQAILADEMVQRTWVMVTQRVPTEKNPNRTLLEKHLTTYTQRNTADYFIHKDLGGFLSNELDFYIKNEVMNLDNVQNAEVFADIEKQLRMIQCLRLIAADVIRFLAQLESFQKKLWTKKKFVTATDYLIPLSLINNSYKEVLISNKELLTFWTSLGIIDDLENLIAPDFECDALVIDTSLISFDLKEKIVADIPDIEDLSIGSLIKSDNSHGLRLVERKLQSTVDLIHIDPPYNTNTSGFLYKNNFRSSSWLTMIRERILASKSLLKKEGVFCCHVDEHEIENLTLLCDEVFDCNLGTMIWDKGAPVTGTHGLASQHEYVTWHSMAQSKLKSEKTNFVIMLKKGKEITNKNCHLNDQELTKLWRIWLKSQSEMSKAELIYDSLDSNGEPFRSADMTATDQRTDEKYFKPLVHPQTLNICPVPKFGWRYKPETMQKLIDSNSILFGLNEVKIPRRKVNLKDNPTSQLPSMIRSGYRGKQELDALGVKFPFAHSSKFYSRLINSISDNKNSFILDYFGGSGTTAHAVFSLNKIDSGDRKFCLMEMGSHFDTTLKPRIIKLMCSPSWKKGYLADTHLPIKKVVKLISLESYEDALNNLELKKLQSTGDLFGDLKDKVQSDYLLNYMLDTESKGSLLSTDDFKKPFDYKMKIAVDSAGAYEHQNIDLVETFNYLIGLHVNSILSEQERGYVRIEGKLPNGQRALILWRDCEKIQYEDFTKFANRFDLFTKEKTYDVIYVNGDHNLPTSFTSDEGSPEKGLTRTLKLRQIEPEFLELMFAPDNAA